MDELDSLVAATNNAGIRPHSVPDWLVHSLDDDSSQTRQRLPRLPPRSGSRLAAAEAAVLHIAKDVANSEPAARPHAPISTGTWAKKTSQKSPGDAGPGGDDKKARKQRRSRRRAKKSTKSPSNKNGKKMSLEDSWKSLHHFSRTNLGRRLEADAGDSTDGAISFHDSNTGSVHFVNIDDSDEASFVDNGLGRSEAYAGNRGGSNSIEVMSLEENSGSFGDADSKSRQVFKVHEPMESISGDSVIAVESTNFEIPVLPKGHNLTVNILSTWGDPYYVGLMGLEIFDSNGHLVVLSNTDEQLEADPPDINVLPEYESDPRTVDKLVDGHNHTCDDMHAWLAPFRQGNDHCIFLTFDTKVSISMMRFWNYNKSRIHSYRGARYVEVKLDGQYIFKGEIQRAPGAMLGSSACAECILFTTDENVLRIIERYDKHPENTQLATQRDDWGMDLESQWRHGWGGVGPHSAERPRTAGVSSGIIGNDEGSGGRHRDHGSSESSDTTGIGTDGRPLTAAGGRNKPSQLQRQKQQLGITGHGSNSTANLLLSIVSNKKPLSKRTSKKNRPKSAPFRGVVAGSTHVDLKQLSTVVENRTQQQYETPLLPCGCIFKFVLLNTYGDPHYVGLNGLELYDENNRLVHLDSSNVDALPKDINNLDFVIKSGVKDVRTLDKLYDGINESSDDNHLWLSPYDPAESNKMFVYLDAPITLSKIKIWNYSKTPSRGVNEIEILIDDLLVYRGSLRKAKECGVDGDLGNCSTILFTESEHLVEDELDNVYNPDDMCVFMDSGTVIETPKSRDGERPTTSAGGRRNPNLNV